MKKKMSTQLSVSSVILAAMLSGCSQQQVIGDSQVVNGSSQVSSGSQFGGGSQQQIENTAAVIPATPQIIVKPTPRRVVPRKVYKSRPTQTRQLISAKPRISRSIKRVNTKSLPAAKSGQCFAKVKIAEKYQTKSRRVLIQKAASKRVLVRAPQYRWINKKVLVRKATYRNRMIPAQYRNKTKRVLVKPAYNTWRKGHGAITRIDNMTGQIMCYVTIPAVYKTVSQRVLVRPAQNLRTLVPAVYKTIKQKQRISAALYKTVHQAARYRTQNYRVKVAAARYVWRPILCKTNAPKNYRKAMVTRKPVVRSQASYKKQYRHSSGISYQQYLQVMNAPMKRKMRTSKKVGSAKRSVVKKSVVNNKKVIDKKIILKAPTTAPAKNVKIKKPADKKVAKPSKTSIKENIVYGIQAALKSKGYNPGKLDGKMGPNTAAALKAFQSSRGLPVGVLSKDTFKALGLVK